MPVLFLFALLLAGPVFASPSLTSETTSGQTMFEENLSLDGDFSPTKDDLSRWGWNLAYDYSVTKSTDLGSSSTVITDKTTEINFGFTWKYMKEWRVDFGFVYARTPDEYLTNSGFNLAGTYIYDKWDFKLGLANLRYVQSFISTSTKRRLGSVRPTVGENTLRQTNTEFRIRFKPVIWFRGGLSFKNYNYDKDVGQFLSTLDSDRAVRTGSDEFSSAVSGMPATTSKLILDFYPDDNWEILFSGSTSKSAYDDSLSRTSRLEFGRDFGDQWHGAVGFQSQSSEATSLNPDPVVDSQAFLSVSYEFGKQQN